MRLISLEAKNLFSYEELKLDFKSMGNSKTLITGVNGSGKSNIPNIISWILTGEIPKKIKPDEVIRWGCDEGEGTLSIEIDGKMVEVGRTRNARAECVWVNDEIYTKTKGDIALKELFGFDAKIFLQIGYLGSKMQGLFLDSEPSKRIALFTEMIPELTKLDEARDRAAADGKDRREELARHQGILDAVNTDLANSYDMETLILSIANDQESLKNEVEKKTKTISRRSMVKRYVETIKEREGYLRFIENQTKAIDSITEEIEKFNTQLIKATEAMEIARQSLGLMKEVAEKEKKLEEEKTSIEIKRAGLIGEKIILDSEIEGLEEELATYEISHLCPISGIGLPKECKNAICKKKLEVTNELESKKEREDGLKLLILHYTSFDLANISRELREIGTPDVPAAERNLAKAQAEVSMIERDLERDAFKFNDLMRLASDARHSLEPIERDLEKITETFPEHKAWTQEELQSIDVWLDKAAKDIAELEARIKYNVKWLGIRQEKVAQKEGIEASIYEVSKQLAISQYWEEGFPRLKFYLLEEIIGRLESLANEYLQEMMPSVSVKLRTQREAKSREGMIDGLDITWINPQGYESRLVTASDGQSRRVALAFFAALHSLICDETGKRLGFLLLDEITENLDHAGQKALVELLNTHYPDKLVLVISHDDDLISLFQNNISVEIDASGASHLQGGTNV
jgi:DNA repair exonuclease SbcCD ATPase subunit